MTAPVRMEMSEKGSAMSFVMPEKYDMNSLPKPKDATVEIKQSEPVYAAVIAFGGYANDEKINDYHNKLVALLKKKNIKILEVNKTPLEKRLDVVDIKNMLVANFVDFAQRFSYNAPYLSANKTYQSDNGQFLIEYLPVIVSSNSGKELTTPARISRVTGRIQVAKKYFDKYTVPMRFAILCHEFSHFYVNENMDDESEADINGLLIYLGLGYPRIEGYQAFLEVFKDAPNENNKKRFDKIDNFIRNFEKNKMVIR